MKNKMNYSTYSLIGLETDRPILRIDDTFFVGTYADTVGSHVLIHIDDGPYDDKPTHDRIDAENDIETIHTKIIFKKVTLKPK